MIAKTRVEKGKKRGIANPVLIVPLCREHNLDEFCFATPLLSYGPFWVTSVREHTKSAEIQLCLWLSIISCKLSHYIFTRGKGRTPAWKPKLSPIHCTYFSLAHVILERDVTSLTLPRGTLILAQHLATPKTGRPANFQIFPNPMPWNDLVCTTVRRTDFSS